MFAITTSRCDLITESFPSFSYTSSTDEGNLSGMFSSLVKKVDPLSDFVRSVVYVVVLALFQIFLQLGFCLAITDGKITILRVVLCDLLDAFIIRTYVFVISVVCINC